MPLKGKELIRKIREAFPPKQAEVLEELFDFLDELVKVHDFNELKTIVAVGYTLENEAYKYLPALLKKFHHIEVIEELKRAYLEIAPDKYIEINIIGRAKKDDKEILILGEGKVNPKISHINEFLRKLEKVKKTLPNEIFPILVCHQIHPKIEKFCREKGISVFLSYQFR